MKTSCLKKTKKSWKALGCYNSGMTSTRFLLRANCLFILSLTCAVMVSPMSLDHHMMPRPMGAGAFSIQSEERNTSCGHALLSIFCKTIIILVTNVYSHN